MEKLKSKAGHTLIELLIALALLIMLVMGMGVGMDAGSRIYRDATFEADSAGLSGILNTTLGDLLRFSIQVRYKGAPETEIFSQLLPDEIQELEQDIPSLPVEDPLKEGTVAFVFTNLEYGIQDGYLHVPLSSEGGYGGVLQLKSLRTPRVTDLVNSGAYPDLVVSDFRILYFPRKAPGVEGGYFDVSYTIHSITNPDKVRSVQTIIRLMND